MNLEIADGKLDAPRETYQEDCRKLATKYQVPWVSFVDELRLPNTSFYDLAHLVEPGRTPWQTRSQRRDRAAARAAGRRRRSRSPSADAAGRLPAVR